MAHVGHFKMLQQAKFSLGDPKKVELVCGVCNDEDTIKYKGKVVMTHEQRCQTMEHCKWVDELRDDAPWVITTAYMEKNRIDFVAHDALPCAYIPPLCCRLLLLIAVLCCSTSILL